MVNGIGVSRCLSYRWPNLDPSSKRLSGNVGTVLGNCCRQQTPTGEDVLLGHERVDWAKQTSGRVIVVNEEAPWEVLCH